MQDKTIALPCFTHNRMAKITNDHSKVKLTTKRIADQR